MQGMVPQSIGEHWKIQCSVMKFLRPSSQLKISIRMVSLQRSLWLLRNLRLLRNLDLSSSGNSKPMAT